jgi:NO-binding membrane sensor protein with MHYT domain
VGIWSAHFLGMIAFKIPVGHGYALGETLLSLVAAVVVSAAAIGYMGKDRSSRQRLLTAGPVAGLAVAVMHYLGMFGLRFEGYLAWNWPLVAASVVIAMVTATTALWLAFNTKGQLARVGAAALMGAAVCAMHYTGMAAAQVCSTPTKSLVWGDWVLRPGELPTFVVVMAVLVLLLVSMDTMLRQIQPAAKSPRAAS